MPYKTCTHIENSLYVAPNEIRACCQRFFYKGKMRGDAKLLNIIDNKTPTSKDILDAREKMLNEIQNGKNEYCKGCNLIKSVKDKPKLSSEIKHLSIEHHSVCNLRCTYCSEVYYGGKRSKYNVVEFITSLNKKGDLKNCNQVVWGGGEPTLDKSFEQILKEIDKNANPKLYHRVFTNSVRYSKPIKQFLKEGKIKITTSIDAGTAETFLKVRGRKKISEVFENLKSYSSIDPTKVTVKYIFTEGNTHEKDIDGFVENCILHNLKQCNFQISLNYKNEKLEHEMLKAISYLFFRLSNNGFRKIFLDDHIMFRFISLNDDKLKMIKNFLINKGSDKILLNPEKIKDLIIYGAGEIADQMIRKVSFFKKIKNFDVVDGDKKKVGNLIFNKKIKSTDILQNDNRPIFIASAQNYDEIYKTVISIKGNSKNIISGLIL